MKIKLSYFLGKRGVDLKGFCENNRIKSYEELEAYLLENRVACPSKVEVGHLFSDLEKQQVKKKKPAKLKQKSASKKAWS